MKTINALMYVTGIYGLTLLVTLFVVAVINVIRWASSERISIPALHSNRYGEKRSQQRD